ncbi:MAG: hypothetical protein K2N14_02015 [Clostridia bacterium]|nr:hypothetical protein [Clostridia bacterium]
MKKIRKALIGITAIAMAFSMSALTACTDTGNTPNNPDSGIENPNNPGNTGTKSDAQKVIEAFQKQSFKAVSLEYSLDNKEVYTQFSCEEDGTKVDGAKDIVDAWHNVMSGSEKMNIKDFEIDLSNSRLTEYLGADGKVVADSEFNRSGYSYSFIRGGYEFYTGGEKEITDFSKVTLQGGQSIEMPEQVSAILAQLPEDGAPADMLAPVTALLNLADIYGGASFADKKLTVDLNKVAYNLYNEVVAEIEKLDEDTTVGDLIAVKPVKNLIESLTYGLEAKEYVDQIKAYFAEGENNAETLAEEGGEQAAAAMAMVAELVKVLPDAKEGESVYDYLVKVLNSKDFGAAVIGLLTGSPLDVPAALGDFKVMQIVSLVSKIMTPPNGDEQVSTQMEQAEMTMEDVKKLIKGYLGMAAVTEDKMTIATGEESSTELSALKLVFAVGDDYTVSSVSFSGNMTSTYSEVYESSKSYDEETGKYVIGYTNREGKETTAITASIEFSKDEYTLTDISNSKVEVAERKYTDRIYYSNSPLATVQIRADAESAPVTIEIGAGLEIKDGVKTLRLYETTDSNTFTAIEGSEMVGNKLTVNYGEYIQGLEFEVSVDENEYRIYVDLDKTANGKLMYQINDYPYVICECQVNSTSISVYSREVILETTVAEILAKNK